MSHSTGTSVNLVITLLAGNIAYLLITLVIGSIIGVSPTDIFSGPFSATAHSLVSTWRVIGYLLVIVDILVVLGFISAVLGGTRR